MARAALPPWALGAGNRARPAVAGSPIVRAFRADFSSTNFHFFDRSKGVFPE